jgi:hypothetical protein
MAARLYADAAPQAAGLRPGLWDGSVASEAATPGRPRSRISAGVSLIVSVAFAWGVGALILMAQFLDHAWWRWITHPYFALPWAG